MTLQTGVRLGVYGIRGPLGARGMGEVCRAWDRRLGREGGAGPDAGCAPMWGARLGPRRQR